MRRTGIRALGFAAGLAMIQGSNLFAVNIDSVNSGGGFGTAGSISVFSTIGQPVIGLSTGSGVTAGQGFIYLLTSDVTELVDTTFPLSTSGWTKVGADDSKRSASYDAANEALKFHVNSTALDNDYRIQGWLSAANDTIRYAAVTSNKFIRSKFYIYTGGQTGTALNEIPNFRVRIASRFAYSAILQPYNHDNTDPAGTALAVDIRPSTSPLFPSIYRVDLDPPDVPQLVNNPNTEGFLRMFEAYEGAHQANGDLSMSESTIGVYPALTDTSTTVPVTQNGLIKAYRPTASTGGDFGNNITVNTPGIVNTSNGAITIIKNFNSASDPTGPMPSVAINSAGVTLETLSVQTDRYGACALDTFNDAGDQSNHLTRARIEPGKQYRVRFHATSTKQTNTQALMRFRVRTLKFMYTANLEVGSSQAQPAGNANNTIAAQVLPGIGNQLPAFDQVTPGENGGWYNCMMVSPMSSDIQADQPAINAQDGPGVDTAPGNNSKSRRDIQFGVDIIDTFSTQPNGVLESGQMTVDKVNIEKYDLLSD